MEQFGEKLVEQLEFLDKLKANTRGKKHTRISKMNADLIREFVEKNKDLPKPPTAHRLVMQVSRLKSIAVMLEDKPLDTVTIEDIRKLNRVMNDKKMASAGCYRKTLRRFLRLKDKKKFFDLLDDEYFKESNGRGEKLLVDPDKFWNNEEIERYLTQSKQHSLRQVAFAAILISSGARPKEILGLAKKDIFLKDNSALVFRINGTKTMKSKRSIVIKGASAVANWNYIKPYLEILTDNQLLFDLGWSGARKIHYQICKLARIPETRGLNFYTMRKQALTRIYGDPRIGYAQACSMAGHVQGSKSMQNYVGFSEEQLIDDAPYEIAVKGCPNPLCRFENEPHVNHCVKCDAPLDIKKYAELVVRKDQELKSKVNELVDMKFELLMSKIDVMLSNR